MKVRTRFAPSPTGSLHLGGVRTALFNWLYARKYNGTFILRIEDTDLARSTHESATGIIETLRWLGLNWDEGPYFQTERLDNYRHHLEQLKARGLIYPAFEKKEELDAMRQKAIQEKRHAIYDRSALKIPSQKVQALMDAGEPFVWRFKVDEGITEVPELLMANGKYSLAHDSIGDFAITRPGTKTKPGMPLYNFACAVDDALMGITHVIRGVEHLPNAVKQVLIYKALGYPVPQYVHLPLIMKNGKKMSKRDIDEHRHFPVSVLERRDLGYLAEATLNYVALLGWAPEDGSDVVPLTRLINEFDLNRLSKANANFDEDKYLFLNSSYIKAMDISELIQQVKPFLLKSNVNVNKLDADTLKKLMMIGKPRCKTLLEFVEKTAFFQEQLIIDEKNAADFYNQKDIDYVGVLETTKRMISLVEPFDIPTISLALKEIIKKRDISFSEYGPIIRFSLTGQTSSVGLAEMMDVYGKKEIIKRLETTIQFLAARPSVI